MESTKTRKNKNVLLGMMSNGDTKEWDCTCLFYAIMYSDCVGKKLHSIVKTSVNELREIRNEVFAHTADGSLSKVDLQASVQKIITAFTTLKLDTTRLEELKGQTSFPTEELNKITQQFDREKERNAEPVSFCVLPPPPSHDTIGRLDEVDRIYEMMKGLSDDNKGQTTVVYLSGNPGCGKSELSRQVGERYFVSDDNTDLAFTMTINASNMDTLLQSYVEFADRLKCDPDSVSRIGTSQGLSLETKVHQLQALTGHQVAKYSSWLIIIDNVTDLKSFSKYWPQSGETTSGGKGQILVTTQDSHSIVDSSHCEHISLSRGMTDEDAVEVLCKISHFPGETDEILLKVAEVLDFQPLALACAGVYMQRIRIANSLFTWQQCLQKVEKGKREATETVYEKTSFNYPTSMTAAVNLALEREMKEEKIMKHAFEFLSSIAQESIPLEYVVQYAMNCMPDEDEDSVAATICSSSLLISSGELE
ncbi:hypothetical protein QZH41_000389 [Actinostola sp. cb2023]|nr:hypothetical protein QZH41_000389 [Actinostola sp. cb2023]